MEPGDRELIFINNLTFNNGMPDWDERLGLVVEGSGWQVTAQNNNWGGVAGLDTPVVSLEGTVYQASQINAGVPGRRTISPWTRALWTMTPRTGVWARTLP